MITTQSIIENSQNINSRYNFFFLPITKDIMNFIRDKIIDVPENENGKKRLQWKNNKTYFQFLQIISLYSYVYRRFFLDSKDVANQKKSDWKEDEITEIEKFCSETSLRNSYFKDNIYNYIKENYRDLLVMELKALNLYEDVKKNHWNNQWNQVNKNKIKFEAFKKFISPLFEVETLDENFSYSANDVICFKPQDINLRNDYRLINPIFLSQCKNSFWWRKPNFMINFIMSSVLQLFLIWFVNEVINDWWNYVLSSWRHIKEMIQKAQDLFKQKIEELNSIQENQRSKASNQAQKIYNKFLFSGLNYFINKPRAIAEKIYMFESFNLKVRIWIENWVVSMSVEWNPESENKVS